MLYPPSRYPNPKSSPPSSGQPLRGSEKSSLKGPVVNPNPMTAGEGVRDGKGVSEGTRVAVGNGVLDGRNVLVTLGVMVGALIAMVGESVRDGVAVAGGVGSAV
jgi:hypothetical protein